MKKSPAIVLILVAVIGVLAGAENCLAQCACGTPVAASPAPAYTSYYSGPVVSAPAYAAYYSGPAAYVSTPAHTAYYSAYSPVYASYYNVPAYTAAYPVYVNRPVYRTYYAAPVFLPTRVYWP